VGFPEELVQQFRQVASERLDQIEQSWAAVMAKLDEDAATVVHRELHTLKGESRMLGFSDVNLVCHKLEDMLEVARMRGYAIDEDFDLAVNMAIRFMAMLVRKKVGSHLVGIDLPGFIKQIDGILAELRPEPPRTARTSTGSQPVKIAGAAIRIPSAMRTRLGPIAVDTFIEYSMARGLRRDRLRTSWHGLRDMIGIHRAVLGSNQLSKHKGGAQALAKDLGKQVDVQFDLEAVEATAEILAAVDSAVLHLVRNGVDHGIETPSERAAAGKPPAGTIRVGATQDTGAFVLTVEDDGRGIVMDDVRKRAVERGLIPPDETDIEDHWVELVCQPGFTTRSEASETSGRGVGLDVVRVGIHDHVAGQGHVVADQGAAAARDDSGLAVPDPGRTVRGRARRGVVPRQRRTRRTADRSRASARPRRGARARQRAVLPARDTGDRHRDRAPAAGRRGQAPRRRTRARARRRHRHRCIRGPARAPGPLALTLVEDAADFADEVRHPEVLGDVAIHARIAGANGELLVRQRREQIDRRLDLAIVAQDRGDVVAEQLRHLHVHQDQIEARHALRPELLDAVARLDVVAGLDEDVPRRHQHDRAVVDDQHALHQNKISSHSECSFSGSASGPAFFET
jgi:two-component system chemotaxis sensor kinase CheA